ncbi:cobalamin-binding protein [Fictibacillus aquaticus]|uniref:Cobalamin-binding protein n=1 Tax=Fictibacillus aquaticus TaxID=2021314 RepID=A0A235F4Y2_9BACL|nr:cobalamin-binding protein [Fictibacillus aquaticus]OYD56356.1 cobalamin-binding protein [Fictibacillus aquaticus]
MRIVSLCPSNTELVHYLGLAHLLKGVDDFSDFPESVNVLPRLGPDLSIDMDAVEKLQPDLILASLSVPGMEKNIDELNRRKLPYVMYNPQSVGDILDDLLDLGMRCGVSERAKQTVQYAYKMMDDYKDASSMLQERPSIYFEWWPKPVFTPGKTNWLTEIAFLAGGVNCFADKESANYQTNWDEVKQKNPDHICMVWVGVQTAKMKPELLHKRPGWNGMKALVQNHIHILDEDLFCRPSPRLFTGLQKLASILHPEQFPAYTGLDPLMVQTGSK